MRKEYVVLLATDPSSLSSQVNALLRDGWQCQGGVALAQVTDDESGEKGVQWAQALIRRDGELPKTDLPTESRPETQHMQHPYARMKPGLHSFSLSVQGSRA